MGMRPRPNSERPRFSVIIPSYNYGHYLGETLDSVLAQTCQDFEIIVVDDGSTDGTEEILSPYLDRIRYVRQQNRGVSATRNAGIAASRGRFLSFLDADDQWESNALQEMSAAFDAHPDVGLVALTARKMDEQGRLTQRIFRKKSPGAFYSTESLLWGDSGCASWFVVRREVLDCVGGYDENLAAAAECDLLLRVSFHTRLMNLHEPLMRYRVHSASISKDQKKNARSWLQILKNLERNQPDWVEAHPWVYRRALGKELLRLGRETLASADEDPESRRQARVHLARSIRTFPGFMRAYAYWVWSLMAPSTFPSWRRRRVARRIRRTR